MKVEQDNRRTDNGPGTGKAVLIGILCVAVVAVLVLVGYKTWKHGQSTLYDTDGNAYYESATGYDSPYALADDFITATFKGDVESIFKMQPVCFQERSLEDNQETYALESEDYATAIANLKRPLGNYLETLNAQHGQWTETHEVIEDAYAYTADELAALQQELKFQGVDEKYVYEITEVVVVKVNVSIEASNGSGGYHPTMKVPVYKHGENWYLGQRIGDTFLAMVEGETDPYGDLLDGFRMTGEWDENGDRIIRNDDGYRVLMEEETGREYYEDIYGNKYYYSSKGYKEGEIDEITGPDGGEPLTADTWEDWWNGYYKEQGVNLYPDHMHDQYGNIRYLDEDGNVTETVAPDGGEPLTEENYEAWWEEHEAENGDDVIHTSEDDIVVSE